VHVAFRIGVTRLAPVLGVVVILVTASPGLAGDQRAQRRGTPVDSRSETRSIDGSGNNLTDPAIGAAGTQLVRIAPAAYADGFSAMAGPERLSAREISNLVNAQVGSIPNPLGASDYLWQWGQFIDHDLDRTDGTYDPPEAANIAVPLGDPFFDPPPGTGTVEIPCNRSLYDPATGSPALGPRQQMNQITAWIDASNVYGSDPVRAAALRADDGSGRLKTSTGNLLPFNEAGLPNAGGTSSALFLAGDVRANEQVGLTAMHTLFVREHNRWVALLAAEHPDWGGDRLYEKARQLVGAELQVITYREFLPALLGRDAIAPYRGYDPNVRADIANEFATAAYRFGHSALSPTLLRLDADGNEIPEGSLALRDAFFAPFRITDEGGIEPLLRGLAAQPCQRIDVYVVDDVRNFLFGAPGSGGFDLASLNIQRGRDHGLPGYNALREALGLRPVHSFAQISSDPEIEARLAAAYASPDEVDAWVGGLAEDSLPGGHVGLLVRTVLVDQFEALRDGDRLWYERVLSRGEIQRVESLRLADVIRLNTGIRDEIQDDVFRVPSDRPHRRRHH
jgi:peroxidase